MNQMHCEYVNRENPFYDEIFSRKLLKYAIRGLITIQEPVLLIVSGLAYKTKIVIELPYSIALLIQVDKLIGIDFEIKPINDRKEYRCKTQDSFGQWYLWRYFTKAFYQKKIDRPLGKSSPWTEESVQRKEKMMSTNKSTLYERTGLMLCLQGKIISMVAVTVGIGGLEDHLGYEGMAHFVEHMLLTGSKKYPAYMKYISSK